MTTPRAFRYLGYEASRSVPNVVVDGSPNEATVLCLSHWPGVAQPAGPACDLSAEMAFAYLDAPCDHPPAEVVTNNHFDQDGIVSILALTEPGAALAHRELLIDLAAAGDFATYRDRRAARASMVLSRYAEDQPPDCGYDAFTDGLYEELLPRVLSMVVDPEPFRELWADEDAELTASEEAIASGRVTIEERPELDLAIVRLPDDEPVRRGHRFGGTTVEGLHPMAVHGATERFRLLFVHGRRYRFVDRYETWVQYRSRPTLPRVDLGTAAAELTALEAGGVTWHAGAPSALTPQLDHDGESSLDPDLVIGVVTHELAEPSA